MPLARSARPPPGPMEDALADPTFAQPRRIFVHAGFHATGGEELRQFLWDNRTALGPSLTYIPQKRLDPVTNLCRIYSQGQNPLVLADLVDLLDEAMGQSQIVEGGDLVISADGLSGQVPGRRGVADYSSASVLAAYVTGYLAERFPAAEISLTYTTRESDDWARAARALLSDKERAAGLAPAGGLNLETEVVTIAEALAPLPVYALSYEEARTHPFGTGGAFLELADLPEEVWALFRPVAKV